MNNLFKQFGYEPNTSQKNKIEFCPDDDCDLGNLKFFKNEESISPLEFAGFFNNIVKPAVMAIQITFNQDEKCTTVISAEAFIPYDKTMYMIKSSMISSLFSCFSDLIISGGYVFGCGNMWIQRTFVVVKGK